MTFKISKLYEILFILRFIYFTEKKKEFTLSKLYEILLILRFIYFTKKKKQFLFILQKKNVVYLK